MSAGSRSAKGAAKEQMMINGKTKNMVMYQLVEQPSGPPRFEVANTSHIMQYLCSDSNVVSYNITYCTADGHMVNRVRRASSAVESSTENTMQSLMVQLADEKKSHETTCALHAKALKERDDRIAELEPLNKTTGRWSHIQDLERRIEELKLKLSQEIQEHAITSKQNQAYRKEVSGDLEHAGFKGSTVAQALSFAVEARVLMDKVRTEFISYCLAAGIPPKDAIKRADFTLELMKAQASTQSDKDG
jgi:hypothetical protein